MFKLEWMLRVLCAVAAGMVLGYERHTHSKEAGIRTHTIVAMASCLLMIISREGFLDMAKVDASRVAAQVVSGVGFLGAGIIFVRQDTIQGLTTAAGIWATSAIGLCIGAGMYEMGVFCTLLMIAVQISVRRLFNYNPPRNQLTLLIHMKPERTTEAVNRCLYKLRYMHTVNKVTSDGQGGWYIKTQIMTNKNPEPGKIIDMLEAEETILDARVLSE